MIKWKDMDISYATWKVDAALKTRFLSFTLEDKGIAHRGEELLIHKYQLQVTWVDDLTAD